MEWSGFLAVSKPAGLTSRQVVDRVAKIVRPAKAGHAGTLDPMAVGLLVIAIGPATRLISYVQQGRKEYSAGFRLGITTDTDDIEGRVLDVRDYGDVTGSMLLEAASGLEGVIMQMPPQYSALHVDGQRAYALARQGLQADLKARPVEVHSLQLTRFNPPDFECEITCGSGTYIRSIGRDIGAKLGCGATMTWLQRTTIGQFWIGKATSLEGLDEERIRQEMLPPVHAVAHLPKRRVDDLESSALRQGKTIPLGTIRSPDSQNQVAVIDEDSELVGIAEIDIERNRIQPRIIFPRK